MGIIIIKPLCYILIIFDRIIIFSIYWKTNIFRAIKYVYISITGLYLLYRNWRDLEFSVAQQAKDPSLSLPWLGFTAVAWVHFLAWELPHAQRHGQKIIIFIIWQKRPLRLPDSMSKVTQLQAQNPGLQSLSRVTDGEAGSTQRLGGEAGSRQGGEPPGVLH